MSVVARKKLVKAKGKVASPLEQSVAQALQDLESSNSDLKAELRFLYIVAAKEVELSGGKKSIVIFVPYRLLTSFHRIQSRLIRELEKKFSDRHVIFIGQRRILPEIRKNNRAKTQKRPRSRTLTAVHDSILEDLVYPTEIVGKRLRVKLDGTKQLKVYLDRKDLQNVEYKLDTFATVYRKLTGKDAKFLFPVQAN